MTYWWKLSGVKIIFPFLPWTSSNHFLNSSYKRQHLIVGLNNDYHTNYEGFNVITIEKQSSSGILGMLFVNSYSA